MCLSIPVKVLSVDGDMADVSAGGAVFKAGLQMLDNVKPGDYVLLHAGFAIQRIDEQEALETIRLLDEIQQSGNTGL